LRSFSIVNGDSGVHLTAVLGLLTFSSPLLEALRIYAFGEVDGVALGTLLSACAQSLKRLEVGKLRTLHGSQLLNLELLRVFGCKANAESLCRLISACPRLRSFHCNNLYGSDACLDALAAHCPLLQILEYQKGDPTEVTSLVHLLQACPDIEVVDISTKGTAENPSATDAHIGAIMQHCRKLKAFAVGTYWQGGTDLSDAAGQAVASRAQDLRHLRLIGCAFTTDAPLVALVQHCGNLQSLELIWSGSTPEPRMGLLQLVRNLHSITHLSFSDFGVRDDVLEAIGANCPLLESLSLMRCGQYTGLGILALARGCRALKKMCISRSEQDETCLPPAARLLWQELRPGLQFSYYADEPTFWFALRDIDRPEIVIW
jgi:hypothetical protein